MIIKKDQAVVILKPEDKTFDEFVKAVSLLTKEYGDRKILYIFSDDNGDIAIIFSYD